jgi:hypothetical protein
MWIPLILFGLSLATSRRLEAAIFKVPGHEGEMAH